MVLYLLYLFIWLVLVFIIFLLFRYLPAKMKATDDIKTKQSLFTVLMISSIPLIFIVIIFPLIILFGDPYMPVKIKYLFILIALVVVLLFKLFRKKK